MKNTVELIGHYGSDETHALSAWTSTSRELTQAKRERIPALLQMLAQNGHHTPFEKSTLHFLCRVDTATHIHLLKHRIGVSINGESARYKELKEPSAMIPRDWPEASMLALEQHFKRCAELYHNHIESLCAKGIDRKRAKESARMFLPYANQLTLDISFNFRSFVHFFNLRSKPDAQLEIADLALQMLIQIERIDGNPFKYTIQAFDL
jgi:flavin-dependent thymidylate synthase